MALGPRLDLRQSQSLVMTPQLQQAIKLLAASNLEIESFVAEALEDNPLLKMGEISREAGEPESDGEADASSLVSEHTAEPGDGEQALDLESAAPDRDYDTGDGAIGGDWGAALTITQDGDFPGIENQSNEDCTLPEHLEAQIGLAAYSESEAAIARYIVGLLDEAGYLPAQLPQIAAQLGVSEDEAEDALLLVQSLDPTGVGARSLSECIALQAKEADRYDPSMARLIDNLDLVARGEFARLKRMCGVDDQDLADMLSELRDYDPKPGSQFGTQSEQAITPDVLLSEARGGGWDITLNEETLPRLVVNRSYFLELSGGASDKGSQAWLKEKIADANWLIKALDQRQKTILKVSAEIVKQQEGFFRRGVSELKPLTLRAVADAIEMHESTVSRVTSNKYLHCARGTFELKYFFTSGVGGGADGEGASSASVKARIKALTDAEEPKKILSDDKLVEILKDEGFDIARRTVAKYREAMGIGSSVQRRRAKKLAGL